MCSSALVVRCSAEEGQRGGGRGGEEVYFGRQLYILYAFVCTVVCCLICVCVLCAVYMYTCMLYTCI